MLFVLFIVGLLVGLTAPRLGAGIDRYRALSERQDVEDQLRMLPRRARLLARGLVLPSDEQIKDFGDGRPPLDLPDGWEIVFSPPLLVSPMGACNKSDVVLKPPAGEMLPSRYVLLDLTCELLPSPP